MYQFKEEKFLSILEKEKVLKNWIRFVSNGFARNDFTKALYAHLSRIFNLKLRLVTLIVLSNKRVAPQKSSLPIPILLKN